MSSYQSEIARLSWRLKKYWAAAAISGAVSLGSLAYSFADTNNQDNSPSENLLVNLYKLGGVFGGAGLSFAFASLAVGTKRKIEIAEYRRESIAAANAQSPSLNT